MPLLEDAIMPTHTTPLASTCTLARTRVITGAELSNFGCLAAANVRPTPEPGFYCDESQSCIYYVAASAHVYLLRTPKFRALLQPADDCEAVLLNAQLLDDEACDRELCLLAEAADAIEAERIADGFYTHRETLYYVSLARVFAFEQAADGPTWHAREVVELPQRAEMLEEDQRAGLMLTVWAEARAVDRATGKQPTELFSEQEAQA